VLSHDVGVPLLHSQTCRTDALPCQDGLRLAFPLFIWPLLADIISPHLVLWRVCAPHLHTPGCGLTIVPSCTAHTATYHVSLVCIPLFPARKTVLYCHQTSSFQNTRTPMCSFLLCKYGVLLCSSNVNTSIPCTQNRAIQLSTVRIFEIYYAKILRKFKFFL